MKNTKRALKRSAVSTARALSPKRRKEEKDAASRRPSLNMKLILSTHNITLTDAIQSHIESRIDQLLRLEPRAIDARVTIEHDHKKVPERQFKCAILLREPGPDLFAEDAERDLYAAIDLVAKKLEQQIRKRHGKFKARNHGEAAKAKRVTQESAA